MFPSKFTINPDYEHLLAETVHLSVTTAEFFAGFALFLTPTTDGTMEHPLPHRRYRTKYQQQWFMPHQLTSLGTWGFRQRDLFEPHSFRVLHLLCVTSRTDNK